MHILNNDNTIRILPDAQLLSQRDRATLKVGWDLVDCCTTVRRACR